MSDSAAIEALRSAIREVPGFPRPDILFYDITTLLKDGASFHQSIDLMADATRIMRPDVVVAMESRGFIFGAPISDRLGLGFVPIRKLGKLPSETAVREYELEYGSNHLEIHRDAIVPGQRVVLVDDLLATGGTVAASIEIILELGGVPAGVVVLVELPGLGGRRRLAQYDVDVESFIRFGGG